MTRHPLFAVILALLQAAASILSGPAMARATDGRIVELCTHAGAVTITVDERGNPVAPHRPCPLCLAARDLALPPAPVTLVLRGAVAPAVFPLPEASRTGLRRTLAPGARAPPPPV